MTSHTCFVCFFEWALVITSIYLDINDDKREFVLTVEEELEIPIILIL